MDKKEIGNFMGIFLGGNFVTVFSDTLILSQQSALVSAHPTAVQTTTVKCCRMNWNDFHTNNA